VGQGASFLYTANWNAPRFLRLEEMAETDDACGSAVFFLSSTFIKVWRKC
jgi:hypothetical protein